MKLGKELRKSIDVDIQNQIDVFTKKLKDFVL